MSPQQKIAARIYELLPHKKELGFGCKVNLCIRDGECIIATVIENIKGNLYKFDIGNEYLTDDEIIGQPIRLADILLAIKKNNTLNNTDWLPFDVLCRNVIIKHDYNLKKDSILEQSDEFCEFLLELLK